MRFVDDVAVDRTDLRRLLERVGKSPASTEIGLRAQVHEAAEERTEQPASREVVVGAIGIALTEHRPLGRTSCSCRWEGDDLRVHLLDVLIDPVTAAVVDGTGEAPCKVGDPDIYSRPDGPYCDATDRQGYLCTLTPGHGGGWHIAGTLEGIVGVWSA